MTARPRTCAPTIRTSASSSWGDNTGFAHAANRGLSPGEWRVRGPAEHRCRARARLALADGARRSARTRRSAQLPARCSRSRTRPRSTTPAMSYAVTACASSAGASSSTTADGTAPARCSALVRARRCTVARRCSRWADSTSTTSPTSRTSISRCASSSPAGAAATSRRSRCTPARARRTSCSGGARYFVTRNTLLLVAKGFPLRWFPYVAYRQLGWAWHALLDGHLATHLRGLRAALPMIPGALRGRRAQLRDARVPISVVVPALPIRGDRAGG